MSNQPSRELPELAMVKGSEFSATERDKALAVLALNSGNTERAARELEEAAKDGERTPSARTLRDWRTKQYSARYMEIQKREWPEIKARLAEDFEDTAVQSLELLGGWLDRLKEEGKQIPARELPRSIREVAIGGAAVPIDKARALRGEMTDDPTPTRNVGEIIRSLQAKGVDLHKLRLTQTVELQAEADQGPEPDHIDGEAKEIGN